MFRGPLDDDSKLPIQALLERPSVVVLPFTNTSGDDSQNYLAFGITDELIAGLQRYKDFPVISRNASLEYKGAGLSADEFTKNLGASYRVEGSITAVNEGIRVLATLSHADGKQVWADRFERDAGKEDLFDLADELVSKVASAVLESEIQRVHRIDRPPSDAWEHYIKGLEVVLNFDPDNYESARRQLDRAVEIAPEMAEAWWAIGELEVANYVVRSQLVETDLDDLYTIIGYFRKSHKLSPFYAAACGCLGYMLTVVGQPDEARAVFSQAIEANPLSPDLRLDYASFLLWDGRYEEAMENSDLAWKIGSDVDVRSGVWINRSIVALADGNKAEVLDAANRAMFISKNIFHMPMAVALLYVVGEREAAARLLDEMEQSFPGISPQNPVLKIVLKPIDDILAMQRERGEQNGPADVNEIYTLLRNAD
jgi:adenylate cyclase